MQMKSLLLEKDQKIERLEKIINARKENASTQVSPDQILHHVNSCTKSTLDHLTINTASLHFLLHGWLDG